MAAARRARAAGFTLPLTLALAFSLMTLATAIVGMVLVSDRQAKAAASDTVTRASLESATEASLFDLEVNGEPQAPEWTAHAVFNGQDVTVTVADPRYKPDINHATAAAAGEAITDAGLRARVVGAIAPAAPRQPRPAYARFVDFAQAAGADPADEDCLRKRLTIGREIGEQLPAPSATSLAPPRAPLAVGALIDLRAEARDWAGRETALWRRVRYTGRPERPWLTHDWRELRLGRIEPACPAPEVVPTIPAGPHRRAP